MSQTYEDLSMTSFPDRIDNKYVMEDVSLNTWGEITQYQNYINNGDIEGATQFLENNTDLIPVIFNADKWNRHEDMIIALENFFLDNVYQYILNIVRMKGTYDKSTRYKKYDVVAYTVEGVTQYYMAGDNVPLGISPVSSDSDKYWIQLTVRGEKGQDGSGLTYANLWDNTKTYTSTQCVSHKGYLWASQKDENIGNEPDTDDGSNWSQIFKVSTESKMVTFADGITLEAWKNGIETDIANASANIKDLKNNDIVIYVSPNGNNDNDGLSESNAIVNPMIVFNKYKNIKSLTLRFADGTYNTPLKISGIQKVGLIGSEENPVKFTEGIVIEYSNVYIQGVSIDTSIVGGTSIQFNHSFGEIESCTIKSDGVNTAIQCTESKVTIKKSNFNCKQCIAAIQNSNVTMIENKGTAEIIAGLSLNSKVNYNSDNVISFTQSPTVDTTSVFQVSNIKEIEYGGTGGTTAEEAREKLGVYPSTIVNEENISCGNIRTEGTYYITNAIDSPDGIGWLVVMTNKHDQFARQSFYSTNGKVYNRVISIDGATATEWIDNTVANSLSNYRKFQITGGAFTNPVGFNGLQDITMTVTSLNPDYINGSVSVAHGGTGAKTIEDARKNLGFGNVIFNNGSFIKGSTQSTSIDLSTYTMFKATVKTDDDTNIDLVGFRGGTNIKLFGNVTAGTSFVTVTALISFNSTSSGYSYKLEKLNNGNDSKDSWTMTNLTAMM